MRKIAIKTSVLSENERIAGKNRDSFKKNNLFVINIIGSPGCGKTTLLEKTVSNFKDRLNILVIIGDVETDSDAKRIKKLGGNAFQIETMGACHLDARMIQRKIEQEGVALENIDLLIIENVGNLVCPAGYDLGEDVKVVILSVTEGDEKPSKYPAIFHRSGLFLITKTDLLPYTDFDIEKAETSAKGINPKINTVRLSAKTGDGIQRWFDWLEEKIIHKKEA